MKIEEECAPVVQAFPWPLAIIPGEVLFIDIRRSGQIIATVPLPLPAVSVGDKNDVVSVTTFATRLVER